MSPIPKAPCSVCGESGDGAHFGAEACRACAAFFRRSVALNKAYQCRNNHQCNIMANVRCMCRACRFQKCLDVGMKKAAVQRHRDVLGKRPADCPDALVDLECTSSGQTKEEGMPTLCKLHSGYQMLENIRKVIHNTDGNTFITRAPRAVDYQTANQMNIKEVNLLAEWLLSSFPEFQELPADQKKLLFRTFFVPFILLESGYFCSLNERNDIIVLPSGDYIDCSRPETFYHDEAGNQKLTSEEAVKLFGPSFAIYRRNILAPMQHYRVDAYEFYALSTMIFWDHGIDGQSDQSVTSAFAVRDRVIKELIFYYRFIRNEKDYMVRMANLMVLLPALQRSVRRFQEDVEISHVFNVYTVDEAMYEMVNGRPPMTCIGVECDWEREQQAETTWNANILGASVIKPAPCEEMKKIR